MQVRDTPSIKYGNHCQCTSHYSSHWRSQPQQQVMLCTFLQKCIVFNLFRCRFISIAWSVAMASLTTDLSQFIWIVLTLGDHESVSGKNQADYSPVIVKVISVFSPVSASNARTRPTLLPLALFSPILNGPVGQERKNVSLLTMQCNANLFILFLLI